MSYVNFKYRNKKFNFQKTAGDRIIHVENMHRQTLYGKGVGGGCAKN